MTADQEAIARLVSRARDAGQLGELTAREREILDLVAEGLSNRAISRKLSLSTRTVETHVTGICVKLGL